MPAHKRPATFSDRGGSKQKAACRAANHSPSATESSTQSKSTSDLHTSATTPDMSYTPNRHDHGALSNNNAGIAQPRCSTPDSLPSLDNGSEGTADYTTLSEDDDTVIAGVPGTEIASYDTPYIALDPSAAPSMPRRLDAHSLQLHNMINDAVCEDGAFDNSEPLVAWDMAKFNGPWSHLKVTSGHGAKSHTAELQMRLAEMEAVILRSR